MSVVDKFGLLTKRKSINGFRVTLQPMMFWKTPNLMTFSLY